MTSSSSKRVKRKKSKKPPKKHYKIDIVTPVFGGAGFLGDLAQSLLYDVDAGIEFKWIIVDDNTPEERGRKEVLEVLAGLEEHEDVVVIKSRENGGFSKTNNIGVHKGKAPLILLLNSDTLTTEEGWLAKMAANFVDPRVGIVGARLLFFKNDPTLSPTRPPGKVQHAGVVFNVLGQPYHLHHGWDAQHPKVMERQVIPAVTGACLMIRRHIYQHLGGLQEIYGTGNFEDVELCVHTSLMNFHVIYDPEVVLYHYSGGSDNSIAAIRNQQIFQLRNKQHLTWNDWQYY